MYGLDESGLTEGYSHNVTDAELVSYDIVYVPRSPIGDVGYLFAQLQVVLPFSFSAVYVKQ